MKKLFGFAVMCTAILFFIVSSCSTLENQPSVYADNRDGKELKDTSAFKVTSCSPTLNYTVRKIGTGNQVLFSMRGGSTRLPNLTMSQNSGTPYKDGLKKGFQNIIFPFTCSISAPVNFMTNKFSNTATKINNFEIEIREPGNWEIVFSR